MAKAAKQMSVWAADTETTTEVDWHAEGCVRVYLWHARRLFSEEERMGTDIDSLIDFLKEADQVWFHNLKYDGSYVLDRLLNLGFTYGGAQDPKQPKIEMIVTDLGQWMRFRIKFGRHVCTLCDSSKKFPGLSLEQIAEVYGIEGKSSLDTHVRREPYRVPTLEEMTRVKGDTRILAAAMEDLLTKGFGALTMASDALHFYKEQYLKTHGRYAHRQYQRDYPHFTVEEDAMIREAYKGGWTYVNPEHRGKYMINVTVYDVNSMYPWAMYSQPLPYGPAIKRSKPGRGELYIVHFSAIFRLKPGHFPSVQKKHDLRYIQSEYITESSTYMELCMTNIDYELFHEQYDVFDEDGHTYLCFSARVGDYRDYIDHWMKEKARCTDLGDTAGRATAKRFLNSLYGKKGQNPVRRSKVPRLDENGLVTWDQVEEVTDGEYLPHAVFITAWARWNIIRNAQRFGSDFIYADTDSIHCINPERHTEGMDIHPSRLGAWKAESFTMIAKYIGPKKYIHLCEAKDGDYRKITESVVACAGMPIHCKEGVTLENFELGAEYEGKLAGRTVKGGYCLIETTYKIKVR